MKVSRMLSLLILSLLLITACDGGDAEVNSNQDKNLEEITAAKTPFALTKVNTPVLNTHEWDMVFGGESGSDLKYDKYGEVDELVFVAQPNTFLTLQRQIRKQTRKGIETIYYRVTTPLYGGEEPLWVDGRFLDLRDVRPVEQTEFAGAARTLIKLRSYEGMPFTWHGSSEKGVPELLEYYPPDSEISGRLREDWMLRGFDSVGLLYQASQGATPLDLKSIAQLGKPVHLDLSLIEPDPGNDDPSVLARKKADLLISMIEPLDIIVQGDRMWVVLDRGEVMESKYGSSFAGKVVVGSLLDTVFGLMQKATFVKNPFEELDNLTARKFFIRRYADTDNLLTELLMEAKQEKDEAARKELWGLCDFSKEAELRAPTGDFDIFGGETFDTLVCGHFVSKEVDSFGSPITRAYLSIDGFADAELKQSIIAGVSSGNGVNETPDGEILLNLGCYEEESISGMEYEEGLIYMEEATQQVILNSTPNSPVHLILSFGTHGGSGCSCCNLAHQVRLY